MSAQDRIAALESRLAAIESRLDALEGVAPPYQEGQSQASAPTLDDGLLSSASTHIGHVLLIFGGAYLLRAITDCDFVPAGIGLAMGAAYAVFWLFSAARKGRLDSARTAAAFYGGTSVLLALPLLVESVTKFGVPSALRRQTRLICSISSQAWSM